MTTEAQIAANRRNAAKSTGPKTTVGKAIVAQNAIKHGLLARQNVILGEDPQQFELHRRGVLGELAPGGVMASILAERIVGLTWRLKRAERLANEAFDYLLARELADSMSDFYEELSPEDEAKLKRNPRIDPRLAIGRVVERDCRQERVMERLMMYEHRIEGSLYRTMNELHKHQHARKPGTSVETQDSASPQVVAANGPCCAKQSQSPTTDGRHNPPDGACAVPVGASAETQNLASLQEGGNRSGTRCAKQSQFPAGASCETNPILPLGPEAGNTLGG